MPFVHDEELLQDFVVEAGELLEQLGEQLVELEQNAQDGELLNAIFRAFHTIKGGAGFLEIHTLVEVCHQAEDVFDCLRQGKRQVDVPLMDVILRVYDVLLDQMESVRDGQEPALIDPELMRQLDQLRLGDVSPSVMVTSETLTKQEETQASEPVENVVIASPVEVGQATASSNDISDDEFEALLDALHGQAAPGSSEVDSQPDTPTDTQQDVQSVANDADQVSWSYMASSGPNDSLSGVIDQATTATNVHQVSQGKEPVPVVAKASPPASKKARSSSATVSEATVRVDTRRLDDIMNLVGELVLVRNRLQTLRLSTEDEDIGQAVENLNIVTADLQASVMQTRMQPVKKAFGRFTRIVRDLSRNLGKEVTLEMLGEDTDLDKNLVEALADPLVHLVRNALDHGIEMPDERERSGKPRAGTLRLTAQQEGDHILLTIEDDGDGMDVARLKDIAVQQGLYDRDTVDRLSDHDCYQLIFAAGFSTKQEISDISGRGVGMDVVKTKINQLNGVLDVTSERGVGTKVAICLPLTLAIMPTLMVVVSGQVFALPLGSIVETTNLTRSNRVDGQEVVMVRNHPLPILHLRSWIAGKPVDPVSSGHVVIVNIGARRVGLVVDQLLGQEEVVIKPLGSGLHGLKGLSGATITGNGKVSLILDIPGLVQKYAANM